MNNECTIISPFGEVSRLRRAKSKAMPSGGQFLAAKTLRRHVHLSEL
jgi:hypothetical protein